MSESGSPANGNQGKSEQSSSGRSKLIIIVAAILFLVAVIFGECLVAYTLVAKAGAENTASAEPPVPEKAEKTEKVEKTEKADKAEKAEHGKKEKKEEGGHGHAEKGEGESKAKETEIEVAPGENVEIDLEQFGVTAHQPASNTTVRIEFHLFGILASRDKGEFERLMKIHQHRFREQVLVTLRSAEGTDLADAGLGLIKRQILEKTNSLLGKPILKSIIVSDFSYIEQ